MYAYDWTQNWWVCLLHAGGLTAAEVPLLFDFHRYTRSSPLEARIRSKHGRMTNAHGSWSTRDSQKLGWPRKSLTLDSGARFPRLRGVAGSYNHGGAFMLDVEINQASFEEKPGSAERNVKWKIPVSQMLIYVLGVNEFSQYRSSLGRQYDVAFSND